MSEFEGPRTEINFPHTEVNPIRLNRDIEYYKSNEAPPRAWEKDPPKTRWQHIYDHIDGLQVAFDSKDPETIIQKLAELSEAEGEDIREFQDIQTKKYIKYDTRTNVVVVIAVDPEDKKNPPPHGEIITAYRSNDNYVDRKLKGTAKGTQWAPNEEKFARVQ